MNWLIDHIHAHPVRLFATTLVVMFASLALAGIALNRTLDAQHAANVAACRSVNELRREIYVAAADLGVPQAVRERFLPTVDCEDLP